MTAALAPCTAGRPRRTVGSVTRSVLLNLAAAGGAVCILLVALAVLFDITLIMFRTGSMSPTIPAGSLAVVREIPATEVAIGDVVTVDRPGRLPVTHRVIGIEKVGAGAVSLTMKGDANLDPDPEPYQVSTVRRVITSVPGLAKTVVAVSDRWVLLGTTLAVSALVTWVCWPRPQTPAVPHGRHRRP